jgi:hypothetical protein
MQDIVEIPHFQSFCRNLLALTKQVRSALAEADIPVAVRAQKFREALFLCFVSDNSHSEVIPLKTA